MQTGAEVQHENLRLGSTWQEYLEKIPHISQAMKHVLNSLSQGMNKFSGQEEITKQQMGGLSLSSVQYQLVFTLFTTLCFTC